MADIFHKRVGDGHGPLYIHHGLAAAAKIDQGNMAAPLTASGFVAVAGTASTGPVCGVASAPYDNTAGAADAMQGEFETGQFWFANGTAGQALTEADRYKACFALDGVTVGKHSAGGTLPVAGIVIDVDAELGVKVLIAPELTRALSAPPSIQAGFGTFAAGVLTVNTGITVTANSKVFPIRKTAGGTPGDEIRVPSADRTVGGPGTGALTFRAFLSAVAATSDTSTFDYLIVD